MQNDSPHTVVTYQSRITSERNVLLERLPDWRAKVHERSDLFRLDTYLAGIIGKSSSSIEVILRNAIPVIAHKAGQSGQETLERLIRGRKRLDKYPLGDVIRFLSALLPLLGPRTNDWQAALFHDLDIIKNTRNKYLHRTQAFENNEELMAYLVAVQAFCRSAFFSLVLAP
jgi:hypothetical protein